MADGIQLALVNISSQANSLWQQPLKEAGFMVATYDNLAQLQTLIQSGAYQMVIIAAERYSSALNDTICIGRENDSLKLGILMLGLEFDDNELVTALAAGVDDCIVGQAGFGPVFIARVRALLRRVRAEWPAARRLDFNPYLFDLDRQEAWCAGELLSLTNREFRLAVMLFRSQGRTMQRQDIVKEIWGNQQPGNSRAVDTQMSRLRSKMNLDGSKGWHLRSVYQRGYRLFRTRGRLERARLMSHVDE